MDWPCADAGNSASNKRKTKHAADVLVKTCHKFRRVVELRNVGNDGSVFMVGLSPFDWGARASWRDFLAGPSGWGNGWNAFA